MTISTALSAGTILTTSDSLKCQTVTCSLIHHLSTLSTQERTKTEKQKEGVSEGKQKQKGEGKDPNIQR